MARPPRLDIALKRLYSALDALETGAQQLAETTAARRDRAEPHPTVGADDESLRRERDAATLRSDALEQAAMAVAERLDGAGATLRRLLASEGEE